MARESGRWSAAGSGIVRSDLRNGLVAVLNPLSWETHILDEWSVGVLELVSQGPISLEELRVRIQNDVDVPVSSNAGLGSEADGEPDGPSAIGHGAASLHDRLDQTLSRLESVHLIQRVPRFAEAP